MAIEKNKDKGEEREQEKKRQEMKENEEEKEKKNYRKEIAKEAEKEHEEKKEKERKEKEKEKDPEKHEEKEFIESTADTTNNIEPLNTKHLGRQKHVEQVTATSPVSPCQVITVTNSDHSSSPAMSSISSQVISTESGQQTGIPISLQPLITTPTVERLLPIGAIARMSGK